MKKSTKFLWEQFWGRYWLWEQDGRCWLHSGLANISYQYHYWYRRRAWSIRNGIGSLSSTGYAGRRKIQRRFELLKNQYYHKDLDQVKMQKTPWRICRCVVRSIYGLSYSSGKLQFDEDMQGSKTSRYRAVVTKKDGVLVEAQVLRISGWYKAIGCYFGSRWWVYTGVVINEAVDKIRGPKGTSVTLTIYRESEAKIMDIVVTREAISVPSARGEIGYRWEKCALCWDPYLRWWYKKVFADLLVQTKQQN
jgi:hypothetical protein